MAEQNGHAVTDSVEDSGSSDLFADFSGFAEMDDSAGDVIEAELVEEEQPPSEPAATARRSQRNQRESRVPREAKTGPPSLDEWTGFFSRVVLRVVTEYYISYAFRGINEDALSEREVERLAMTDEERQLIAVPFAEISNKSKFMRKHGRMIVASGDAFNALVVLGMWASRVNRIAAKHRSKVVKGRVNGSSGQSPEEAAGTAGTTGGFVAPGFTVFPGSS